MRFQITNNGADTTWVQNKTIGGLIVAVEATGELTYNSEAVQITCTLQRAGRSITVVSGNLLALAKGDNPGNAETSSITADSQTWQGYYIPFGEVPYNLTGDDRFSVSASVSGAVNAVTTVSVDEAVGVETYTPIINVYPIPKTSTRQTLPLGQNITKVTLVQTGNEFGITTANLQTSLLNRQLIGPDLKALVAIQRSGNTTSGILDRTSCIIYQGHPASNGELDITVDTAQASNTYVVVFAGEQRDLSGRVAAENLAAKISRRNNERFGVYPIPRLDTLKTNV